MEMKKAVALAKVYILDLYADEGIDEVGLEEIEYDEAQKIWKVTVGFRRPWGREPKSEGPLASLSRLSYRERWYKAVEMSDEDGRLISVKDRILKDAA